MSNLNRALWLDVESSGLAQDSYPIEVGWCDLDGHTGNVLIQPLPAWTYWDREAEALHGITRAKLAAEGGPVAEAAARIAAATAGRVVYSDAPSYDMAWLFRLFTVDGGKGVPFRLENADILARQLADKRHLGIIGRMEAELKAQRLAPITHRAADDAKYWATLTRLLSEND